MSIILGLSGGGILTIGLDFSSPRMLNSHSVHSSLFILFKYSAKLMLSSARDLAIVYKNLSISSLPDDLKERRPLDPATLSSQGIPFGPEDELKKLIALDSFLSGSSI